MKLRVLMILLLLIVCALAQDIGTTETVEDVVVPAPNEPETFADEGATETNDEIEEQPEAEGNDEIPVDEDPVKEVV